MERKAFFVLLLALLFAGAYVLLPFLKTVVLGLAFVVLFDPLHHFYLRRLHGRRNLAAICSTLSVIIFFLIPIATVAGLLITQITAFLSGVLTQTNVTDFVAQWNDKIGDLLTRWHLATTRPDFIQFITQTMQRLASTMAQHSPQVVENIVGVVVQFLILSIVLYYFFRDGRGLFSQFVRLTPIKDAYEHRLAGEIRNTIRGVFYGSFLTALIQATLATIGFILIGIGGSFVWGVLTFLVSFLPMIGTGAVLIPLILFALFQADWSQAFELLVLTIVIGSIDNLLKPFLMRGNVHPLWLFLSLFGGFAVFGATGLLLGPMVMALLTATLRIYEKDFTDGRNGGEK